MSHMEVTLRDLTILSPACPSQHSKYTGLLTLYSLPHSSLVWALGVSVWPLTLTNSVTYLRELDL